MGRVAGSAGCFGVRAVSLSMVVTRDAVRDARRARSEEAVVNTGIMMMCGVLKCCVGR